MSIMDNDKLPASPTQPPGATTQWNIPVVEESEAAGEVAQTYADCRALFGRPNVPGILKCFSSSPPVMRHIFAMSQTLLFSEGSLTRRRKEMIASHVSRLNDCSYCLDSHAFHLRNHGGGGAVDAILHGQLDSPAITPAESLLLTFVGKVTAASHLTSAEDIQSLRDIGWTDEQIAETIHLAGAFAFFNRVANTFGLRSQGLLGLGLGPSQDISQR